jgi:hypothetical protein
MSEKQTIYLKEYLDVELNCLENNNLEKVISLFENLRKDGWEFIDNITYTDTNCDYPPFMTLSKTIPLEVDKDFIDKCQKQLKNDIWGQQPKIL